MKLIGKNVKGTPVAPLMGAPGIQLTNTKLKQNFENANIQFDSLVKLYDKFKPDAMFNMMDLTVEAEALEAGVLKPENEPFSVVSHPIKNEDDFKKLSLHRNNIEGRMKIFLDVISYMKSSFDCKVISYIIGPYTLAGLLNGTIEVIKNVNKNPEFLKDLLRFTSDFIYAYGNSIIDKGADALCILEPTAMMLSPQQFVEFSGKYITNLILKWPIPSILHICGNTSHLIPKMVETHPAGISLDSLVDLAKISSIVPQEIDIIGNIDPVNVVAYGDKGLVKKKVLLLVNKMKKNNNFILSTGCDLPQDTNLENIELFINLARNS
jgi:uroporphyrinogen decarboxylase